MAGAILKTFGVLTLILGILLLLAGLGALGYGYFDEQQHAEDSGPLGVAQDQDRSDQNEALLMGGAAATVVGLLLIIIGIVLIATGSGRATRARHRELIEATTAKQGGAEAAAVPAREPTTEPAEGAAGAAIAPAPMPEHLRRLIPIAVVIALLVVAVVVAAVGGFDNIGGDRNGSSSSQSDGPSIIDTVTYDRTIPATATVLGSSRTPESTSHEFTAPAGTDIVAANVTWEPAETGSTSIQFSLEINVDGTWVEIGSTTDTSPIIIRADDADGEYDFTGASMRFRAFPGDDGVNEAQDYQVTLTFSMR